MRDVKFFLGILGQFSANVRQLVLEGLATTSILAVDLAYLSNSLAYRLNINNYLLFKNLVINLKQVSSLHSWSAWIATQEYPNIDVLKRYTGVSSHYH